MFMRYTYCGAGLTMGTERICSLYCDKCGEVFDHGITVDRLRELAKIEGWIRRGKDDLCNDCKQDKRG